MLSIRSLDSTGNSNYPFVRGSGFSAANQNDEHPIEICGRLVSDLWVRTKENSAFHFDGKVWHQTKFPAPFDSTAKLGGSK